MAVTVSLRLLSVGRAACALQTLSDTAVLGLMALRIDSFELVRRSDSMSTQISSQY